MSRSFHENSSYVVIDLLLLELHFLTHRVPLLHCSFVIIDSFLALLHTTVEGLASPYAVLPFLAIAFV